jgi:hypothetical protein
VRFTDKLSTALKTITEDTLPQVEKRPELSKEQLEKAWAEWSSKNKAAPQVAEKIQTYIHLKMVPKGVVKGAAPAAPTKQREPLTPHRHVATGPYGLNKHGKMVRADAGIGRPLPPSH